MVSQLDQQIDELRKRLDIIMRSMREHNNTSNSGEDENMGGSGGVTQEALVLALVKMESKNEIAEKEIVRMKETNQNLNNEISNLKKKMEELEKNLKVKKFFFLDL
jgi:hypothetical protein